jgi:hypothetical protein
MSPIQRPVRVVAAAMLWLVALVTWPAEAALAAPVRVTAVTLQEAPSGLQVSIATSAPAPY